MSADSPVRPLTAAELFAHCAGSSCAGAYSCHFCGSPCTQAHPHDDLPPTIGVRSKSRARCPGNPWMCIGCNLWRRRKRVTANWLGGGQLDGTFAGNHSWLFFDRPWSYELTVRNPRDNKESIRKITLDPGAYAVRFASFELLYHFLLKPLGRWCLTLRADCRCWETGKGGSAFIVPDPAITATENMLHVARANNVPEVLAGTEFVFTLNNAVHSYSPYELEQGLRHGKEGKEPGVRVLIELLGPHPLPPEPPKPGDGTKGHLYPDPAHRTLGKKIK